MLIFTIVGNNTTALASIAPGLSYEISTVRQQQTVQFSIIWALSWNCTESAVAVLARMAYVQSLGFRQEIGAATCAQSSSGSLPCEYPTVATKAQSYRKSFRRAATPAVRSLSCTGAVHHANTQVLQL